MSQENVEVIYEEEAAVKFLRAETLFTNCIENPNNLNCVTDLYNETKTDNLWAQVRYIEVQLHGIVKNEAIKIKKPKKMLKEMAKDHFYFAQLKWAQYTLIGKKSGHEKCKKAVKKLMELTDKKGYCADAYYYLGLFYMEKGKIKKSKACLINAYKYGHPFAKHKLDDMKNGNCEKVK